MSRFNPHADNEPVLRTADVWRDDCLLGNGALLDRGPIWTRENVGQLVRYFVENLDEGDSSFFEKLELQLEPASPEARCLAAEMLYMLLLCPSNIGPEKKRENVLNVWSWSQRPIDENQALLQDDNLRGVGSGGTGFNNHRWREMVYLIRVVDGLLALDEPERRTILNDPERLPRWLEGIPENETRQFRHMLLFMLHPDEFERVFGGSDRKAIIAAYTGKKKSQVRHLLAREMDEALREIRAKQEEKENTVELDFYETPLWEDWHRDDTASWLFSWDPKHYDWKEFNRLREAVIAGDEAITSWICTNGNVSPGDTAFILRTGKDPKGIVARGNVANGPYEDLHWDPDKADVGEMAQYVDIQLTDVRDPAVDTFISLADLKRVTVDNQNWNPQESGIEIKQRSAKVLHGIWDKLPPVVEPYKKSGPQPQAVEPPRNVVLYGPPGTGKTYEMRRLQERYEEKATRLKPEEWLADNLQDVTWWQTALMALIDLGGKAPVSEIIIHPYFQTKAKLHNRNERNLRATCWASLHSHTVPDSETVNTDASSRRAPYVFDKDSEGNWFLTNDWQDSCSEFVDKVEEIKKGPSGNERTIKRHETVTFHQSYGYEDFVEGIRPHVDEDSQALNYDIEPGVFKKICDRARRDPAHRYAIFIDEVNRGNVAKILGELITLIEPDKRAVYGEEGQLRSGMEVALAYSGKPFGVPRNLDIYAAMNTADRSIAPLDAALRRRFQFRELIPDPQKIAGEKGDGYIPDGEGGLINLRELLSAINQRVEYLVHRDQTIGHSFFMNVRNIQGLRAVLVREIIPQLQEYFYNDWSRIQMVFGDTAANDDLKIIRRTSRSANEVFGQLDEDLPEAVQYRIVPEEEITADAIRKIYEPDA